MLLLHWLNQSELLWTLSQRHHISLILSWPQFPPNNIYVYTSCLERPQFSDCIQFSWHFKVVVLKLDMVVILLWPGSSQKPYMGALWPRDTWVLVSTTREGLCSGDCGPQAEPWWRASIWRSHRKVVIKQCSCHNNIIDIQNRLPYSKVVYPAIIVLFSCLMEVNHGVRTGPDYPFR